VNSPAPLSLYVGTYTDTGSSRGIYHAFFDPVAGTLSTPSLVAETPNPSFLAFSPDVATLYAVNESPGGVRAYEALADGTLAPRGDPDGQVVGPCDLAVDRSAQLLAVAEYTGGATSAYALGSDGRIAARASHHAHAGRSTHPTRQEASHAHGVTFSPDGRFLAVPDLGTDKIRLYVVDRASSTLRPHPHATLRIAPGSGPRHVQFSPDGRHLYVLNELSSTLTVAAFAASTGHTRTIETVPTLPVGFSGPSTTAEIAIDAAGRFIYASNRGHDSIVVFSRDPSTGRLSPLECVPTGGRTPRHFALAPGGEWLLVGNQDSDTLSIFRLDTSSGRLSAHGTPVAAPRPVCLRFRSYP
jgi:6-phosphogluconolactonase